MLRHTLTDIQTDSRLAGGLQDNLVSENHCSDNGIYGKQTSFFFEAQAGHNTVVNNVMYNGPRAGINFNDGAVGGTLLQGNLIFGHGRETSDHGAVNSWDRCPFQSKRGNPADKSGFMPAVRHINRNFIMNGGIFFATLVHDDGATYFSDTNNLLVYGGVQVGD